MRAKQERKKLSDRYFRRVDTTWKGREGKKSTGSRFKGGDFIAPTKKVSPRDESSDFSWKKLESAFFATGVIQSTN